MSNTKRIVTEEQVIKKYNNKRNNALHEGKEFSLSLLSIKNLMQAKYCFYTGVEMVVDGDSRKDMNYLTIDRVDPSKGYIKGNVVACSMFANRLKGEYEHKADFSLKEFKRVSKIIWNRTQQEIDTIAITKKFFQINYSEETALDVYHAFIFRYKRENVVLFELEELKTKLIAFCGELSEKGIMNINDNHK